MMWSVLCGNVQDPEEVEYVGLRIMDPAKAASGRPNRLCPAVTVLAAQCIHSCMQLMFAHIEASVLPQLCCYECNVRL